MPIWGEPVKGRGNTHDFKTEPVLVAEFQRSERVYVPDFDDPSRLVARTIHRFFDESDVPADVWGSADLDGKLRVVKPGQLVRIEFTGTEDLPGGKTVKRFTVQVDTSGVSEYKDAESETGTLPDTDDDIPF